jgi:hypothetical protein
LRVPDSFLVHFHDQFLKASGSMGCFPKNHLIKHDSHRVDVTLGGVGASIQYLGAHVDGTSDQRLMDLGEFSSLAVVLCEPKICNFVRLVLYQHVGRFQISMDDRMVV